MKPSTHNLFLRAAALLALSVLCGVSCGSDKEAAQNEKPADAPRIQIPAPATHEKADASGQKDKKPDSATIDNPQTFLKAQEKAAAEAPFRLTLSRIGFEGGCARGDDPDERPDAPGIRAVVSGTLTWQGDDLLYGARLDGALFVSTDDRRLTATPPFAGKEFLTFSDQQDVRFTPSVRGASPWAKGETRKFHFRSAPLNEVWCEVRPTMARLFLALEVDGLMNGTASWPLGVWSLPFDEIVGMALRQQVQVEEKSGFEAADAHFVRLDRMLVTRLTGRMEWLPRNRLLHEMPLVRADGALFPVEAAASDWLVRVLAIASRKEYGGYAPRGEDQFLSVLSIELVNGTPEEASLNDLKFRLETAPGVWVSPAAGALEQLNTTEPLAAGTGVSGSVVFPRQRFERPFRLEVTTPKKHILLLDVFDYRIGPERSPVNITPPVAQAASTP